MSGKKPYTQFAVIGLGRFGLSVVKTLAKYDVSILAVDANEHHLNESADFATSVVQANISEEGALDSLSLGNFDVVVIATGEDFEASVLATISAKEQGAKQVVVKALGERQKRILEKIGADTVVLPEIEMGARLARSLAGPEPERCAEQM